jgi:hypothetical protein
MRLAKLVPFQLIPTNSRKLRNVLMMCHSGAKSIASSWNGTSVYSIPRRVSTVFSALRLTIRLIDTRAGHVRNIPSRVLKDV